MIRNFVIRKFLIQKMLGLLHSTESGAINSLKIPPPSLYVVAFCFLCILRLYSRHRCCCRLWCRVRSRTWRYSADSYLQNNNSTLLKGVWHEIFNFRFFAFRGCVADTAAIAGCSAGSIRERYSAGSYLQYNNYSTLLKGVWHEIFDFRSFAFWGCVAYATAVAGGCGAGSVRKLDDIQQIHTCNTTTAHSLRESDTRFSTSGFLHSEAV